MAEQFSAGDKISFLNVRGEEVKAVVSYVKPCRILIVNIDGENLGMLVNPTRNEVKKIKG
jgi:hypothetical protein